MVCGVQCSAKCSHTVTQIQGYVEAARAFEHESGTPPGVELSSITNRMEVRRAVQSGNVEGAIDKVNDMNPNVRELVGHFNPLWSINT